MPNSMCPLCSALHLKTELPPAPVEFFTFVCENCFDNTYTGEENNEEIVNWVEEGF